MSSTGSNEFNLGEHFISPNEGEQSEAILPPDIPHHGYREDGQPREWNNLTPYEQELIIRSQTVDVESPAIPEIRVLDVMRLVDLLFDAGIVDAAAVDEDFIRQHLGVEHLIDPYLIEECLRRIKVNRLIASIGDEGGAGPIKLDDIVLELNRINKEKEYQSQIEDDLTFLKTLGVDYRQLDTMHERGGANHERIRLLAADLRSGLFEDIVSYRMAKTAQKNKRPEMISLEDISLTVLARKAKSSRQEEQLLEGEEGAITKATDIYLQLINTPEGMQKILIILAKAKEENNVEVVELLATLIKGNTVQLSDPDDFFGEEFIEWIEKNSLRPEE